MKTVSEIDESFEKDFEETPLDKPIFEATVGSHLIQADSEEALDAKIERHLRDREQGLLRN